MEFNKDLKSVEKVKPVDKINLSDLLSGFQVDDGNSLKCYLLEIWGDLSLRSKEPSKGVEKITFNKYYDLPGIISERLFNVFDTDGNGFLEHKEFIQGMKTLFLAGESFTNLAKFVFKFYDFDKDDKITREDVRVVLSYVPLQSKGSGKFLASKLETTPVAPGDANYKDRVESQNELHSILDTAFGKKESLDLDDYINVVENVNSDIFILILMFLLEKRPFTKETLKIFKISEDKKGNSPDLKASFTPTINKSHSIASPSLNTRLISPTLKKRASKMMGNSTILNMYSGKSPLSTFAKKKETKTGSIFKLEKCCENEEYVNVPENEEKAQKKPTRRDRKNLRNLEDKTPKIPPMFTFGAKKDTPKKTISDEEDSDKKDSVDLKDLDLDYTEPESVKHEGYMYKLTTRTNKLKKLYFKLVDKHFFYFKNKEDPTYKGLHNLCGIFIKRGEDIKLGDKTYYTLNIVYPQKSRVYLLEDEKELKKWLDKFKQAVEYRSLTDKYIVKDMLGQGKFGLVKYGIQKGTGKEVAIKIMAKKEMDNSDLELAKTEIDILSVCQHPNIIKIHDIYETEENIYIVMDYYKGGDLFNFIEKRDFRLPEAQACEIIHKLAMAIYYLHSFGIIHRDIKPENILMTDTTNKADIKLLDFGLSKILGPNEKCKEPYGTLSFVAPEVLQGKEYSKEVDIWSLGIITFLLLCGYLPFDDEHSEREIARKTIEEPVKFSERIWSKFSKEAKDFVQTLLKKKQKDRPTIEQVLEHPWIKKFSKVPEVRLSKDSKINKFEAYSSAV